MSDIVAAGGVLQWSRTCAERLQVRFLLTREG